MKITDHFLTQETFSIEKTEVNGLYKTNPFPPKDELDKYYNSKDYLSHNPKSESFFARIYQVAKSVNSILKWNAIQKFTNKKDLWVDYGCGLGDFAEYVEKKGNTVFGFEPNEQAAKIATEKLLNKVKPTEDFLEMKDNSIGVLMLWHVLEHVYDLDKTVELFHQKLKENGVLVLALPNHSSFDAGFYKEDWAAWDVPRHLHHFNTTSVKKYFDKNGFKLLAKRPLHFDSYYVSILSERYKQTGLLGFIWALIIASISNAKAFFTGEYSSIIYVLKKKD